MAARKKSNRAPSKTKSRGVRVTLWKAGVGLCILVGVVVAAALATRFLMPGHKNVSPALPTEKMVVKKIPAYEIYPKEPYPPITLVKPEPLPKPRPLPKPKPEPRPEPKPLPEPEPRPSPFRPRPEVAIIIDDIGYDVGLAEKFMQLDSSLTLSILPKSTYHRKAAELARDYGCEIMLHLPMEPREYPDVSPGPGALLLSMSPDELIRQLEENIDAIPGIKGVNNHMGSKMTADSERMNQIFSILKQKELFFIDSKTTSDSVCESSAALFQVPFSQRDVFIDHFQDLPFIRNQIRLLVKIAQRHGTAIGIGHPHEATFRVLRELLPEIKQKATIVRASAMVGENGP
jgi:uncharacterized protein